MIKENQHIDPIAREEIFGYIGIDNSSTYENDLALLAEAIYIFKQKGATKFRKDGNGIGLEFYRDIPEKEWIEIALENAKNEVKHWENRLSSIEAKENTPKQ